jgi:hypothetical protein
MRYSVGGMEKRLHLLRIQVTGSCLEGTLDAFFRPRPVEQRALHEVASVVAARAFDGQRVLVVGGSRGLGELTAKITVAGGADVTITYAHGHEDAQRVCAEALALGRRCAARHLDLSTFGTEAAPQWLAESRFSHVYFFASPPIAKNIGRWSDGLFAQFARIYVTGFAALVEQVLAQAEGQQPTRFLYPSSVFVTRGESGFAEYAVAKAAGEALCEQLARRRDAQFLKPRLPRMRTDQTSSLVDIGAVDAFPIMLDVVRQTQS